MPPPFDRSRSKRSLNSRMTAPSTSDAEPGQIARAAGLHSRAPSPAGGLDGGGRAAFSHRSATERPSRPEQKPTTRAPRGMRPRLYTLCAFLEFGRVAVCKSFGMSVGSFR